LYCHDEITQMLAEHGSLGAVGLLILFVTLVLYLENKFNMYLLCFVAFWFSPSIMLLCERLFRPLFVITLNVQLVPRVPQKRNHYRLVEPTVNN
jgi:hypothetical protein